MRKQTDLEKELEQMVYGHRLLVLLEGSEGFQQVIFTKEHFKVVSDAVVNGRITEPANVDSIETVMIDTGDILLPKELFEGMSDF